MFVEPRKIVATRFGKAGRLKPPMKTISIRFFIKVTLALSLAWILPSTSPGQSADNIPLIKFQDVPITTAIESLARQAKINFIVDPKLFLNTDGTSKPEPSLTFRWENLTAGNALARMLKENGLVMRTNAFSTVVCITGTNATARQIDVKLLGNDTNGVIPLIHFIDVPVSEALKSLIKQGHVTAVLDPQVSGDAPPSSPDFKMVMAPTVSVRWENLTARQAIVEICDVYGLVIVKGSAPDTVVIKLVQCSRIQWT